MLNKEQIDKLLTLLGQRIELERKEPIEIVVCGGSSLIVTGLISRTTVDIDMIGLGYRQADGKLFVKKCDNLLPEIIDKNVHQIANDLGLEKNWLNVCPVKLIAADLPDGIESRLQSKKYGNVLTVHFIGRIDQIYFKLYAATDIGAGKHLDDLKELNPKEEELAGAINWVFQQDDTESFREKLKNVVKELGYERIADRI